VYVRTLKTKIRRIRSKLKEIPLRLRRIPWDLKIAGLARGDLILEQKTAKLLSYQVVDSVFKGDDIIVRLLAINGFSGGNNFGISLFKKMHKREKGINSDEAFEQRLNALRSLIQSISGNGFKSTNPIKLNFEQRLIDGSSRLAAALYFGIKEVPIEITRVKQIKDFDISWFRQAGFAAEEIKQIEETRLNIFREWGLYFPVILWPPVQDYFDKIEGDLSETNEIISSIDYSFSEDSEFRELVKKIYAWEAVEDRIIDMKIEGMLEYPLRVRLLNIELPEPDFKKKRGTNNQISSVVKDMKEDLRRAYAGKVENYFRDIIIHIGDNFEHNLHITKVFDDIQGKSSTASSVVNSRV
jgi:hypothetical protein